MFTKYKSLIIYLILVFSLSAIFIASMKILGKQGYYLAGVYMFTPAIAAVITRIFFYPKKFTEANLKLGKLKYFFQFWLISLGITVLSATLYWLFGAISWDMSGRVFLGQLSDQMALTGQNINDLPANLTPRIMLLLYAIGGLTVLNILPGIIVGFGEEFGWRGLMFPLLYKIRPWVGFIIGGLIWLAWHLPLALVIPASQPQGLLQSILNIIILAVGSLCTFAFFVYVYYKSRSIWVVSFAHITIDNSQRVLSYFVVLEDQLIANLALAATMFIIFMFMLYTKKFDVVKAALAN